METTNKSLTIKTATDNAVAPIGIISNMTDAKSTSKTVAQYGLVTRYGARLIAYACYLWKNNEEWRAIDYRQSAKLQKTVKLSVQNQLNFVTGGEYSKAQASNLTKIGELIQPNGNDIFTEFTGFYLDNSKLLEFAKLLPALTDETHSDYIKRLAVIAMKTAKLQDKDGQALLTPNTTTAQFIAIVKKANPDIFKTEKPEKDDTDSTADESTDSTADDKTDGETQLKSLNTIYNALNHLYSKYGDAVIDLVQQFLTEHKKKA